MLLRSAARSHIRLTSLAHNVRRTGHWRDGKTSLAPSIRHFSTRVDPPSDESSDPPPSTFLARAFTPQVQTYLMIGGGAVGTLLVARVVVSFTSFFTHLTPLVMAKWGFYMGFGTAGAMGALAAFTYDTITIRADPVFRYGLKKIQSNDQCIKALGDGVSPGKLRSYRLDPGRFEASSAYRMVYRPPRIQMIFDVQAQGPPYRAAICTIEAHKATGAFPPKLTTTLLKVDFEDGDVEENDRTIWLVGDQESYQRVSRRSGIRLSELGQFMHINKAARK
jgi:hypothetical protein